jgi:CHAD domain-containing protein
VKLQPDHVETPLRKLRKQLKGFPSNPPPKDVHSLRTQTRRLEATVAALVLDREKEPRRLIKLITPVRKAAGKVRDMDVLIGDVLTLSGHQGSEAVVRLVEHLARMRVKAARKLRGVVSAQQKEARRRLKQSWKLIRRKLNDDAAAVNGDAAPQILITELRHWPDLNADNLHIFRIRIKELRYMLQLSLQADGKLVDTLSEVKDSIGEWHDWVELLKIAQKVLDPREDREVLKDIETIAAEKLQRAMMVANQLRERYFSPPDGRRSGKKVLQMAS